MLANAKQRFIQSEASVKKLIEMNIIKVDNEMIVIDFLDAQLKERAMLHKLRVSAGRKGGNAKKLQASAKICSSNAKLIRKEKKRKDKKREEDIYREFAHLSLSETEFESLKKKGLTKQQIDSYCDLIENYAKNKNYTSLNLTIQSWWRRDKKSSPSEFDNGIGGM